MKCFCIKSYVASINKSLYDNYENVKNCNLIYHQLILKQANYTI